MSPITWPRTYLLQLYASVVEHGMIFVEPITAEAAASLKASFYRLRRKRDSNSQWILPEYHLVSVAAWEPDGVGPLGRLPIIYSRLPSGAELPGIRPASSLESIPAPDAPSHPDAPQAAAILNPAASAMASVIQPNPGTSSPPLELSPASISSYVDALKRKAAGEGSGS